MPAISNYYAQLGVEIQKGSAEKVSRYLANIRRRVTTFQNQMNRQGGLRLSVSIDRNRALSNINRDLRNLTRGVNITLQNVRFDRSNLVRSLNDQLRGTNSRVNLSARISQNSLNAMRDQVRNALQTLTVSPTINPRLSRGTFGSGALAGAAAGAVAGGRRQTSHGGNKTKRMSPIGNRKFNPWYNPMMLGGGLGAFIRYGAFSLPAIGGVLGLNALANRLDEIEGSRRRLAFATGSVAGGREQEAFLASLGSSLGFSGVEMAAPYSKYFESVKGTSLAGNEQSQFAALIDYATVAGANRETVVDMFSRIAQRGVIRTTDLDQLHNAGLNQIYQLMADAVTGGNVAQLTQSMKGQGLKAEDVLPKFFQNARREANIFLGDYYKSIERHRGRSRQTTSAWLQNFMGGGVDKAIVDFYRTWEEITRSSADKASDWGNVLAKIIHGVNTALLTVKETAEWFTGRDKEGNFLTRMFGKAEEQGSISFITESIKTLGSVFVDVFKTVNNIVGTVLGDISKRIDETTESLYEMVNFLDRVSSFASGGFTGINWTLARQEAGKRSRRELERNKPEATPSELIRAELEGRRDFEKRYPTPQGFIADVASGSEREISLSEKSLVGATISRLSETEFPTALKNVTPINQISNNIVDRIQNYLDAATERFFPPRNGVNLGDTIPANREQGFTDWYMFGKVPESIDVNMNVRVNVDGSVDVENLDSIGEALKEATPEALLDILGGSMHLVPNN